MGTSTAVQCNGQAPVPIFLNEIISSIDTQRVHITRVSGIVVVHCVKDDTWVVPRAAHHPLCKIPVTGGVARLLDLHVNIAHMRQRKGNEHTGFVTGLKKSIHIGYFSGRKIVVAVYYCVEPKRLQSAHHLKRSSSARYTGWRIHRCVAQNPKMQRLPVQKKFTSFKPDVTKPEAKRKLSVYETPRHIPQLHAAHIPVVRSVHIPYLCILPFRRERNIAAGIRDHLAAVEHFHGKLHVGSIKNLGDKPDLRPCIDSIYRRHELHLTANDITFNSRIGYVRRTRIGIKIQISGNALELHLRLLMVGTVRSVERESLYAHRIRGDI